MLAFLKKVIYNLSEVNFMTLQEISQRLGISSYPEKFNEIYLSLIGKKNIDTDSDFITSFENNYEVLREHFLFVMECWNAICKDKDLFVWYRIICKYLKSCTRAEASNIPLPADDLTPSRHMFAIYPLLAKIPDCVDSYKRHGFSYEEIKKNLIVFYNSLNLVKESTGSVGINLMYYQWILNYIYCEIYDIGSFNFQFTKLYLDAVLLKNKLISEHVILMTDGVFHKCGQILGSAGYEDEEGSFNADYEENETSFIGRIVINGYVSQNISEFKKSEWTVAAKYGDDILSVHIPRSADLSLQAIQESYLLGMKTAKERFPEYSPQYLYCRSWIIDPRLENFLQENSKITGFGRMYMRFPVKCTGRDGRYFLFSGSQERDENLPENTSLQRKIKTHYLNGGYTYASAGFVVQSDLRYPISESDK